MKKGEDYSTFWGEIAPNDHLVQIYENDEIFLDKLTGFVSSGLKKGDSSILIATSAHINALETQLASLGYDISILRKDNKFITLEAEEVLKKFMINGWPSDVIFSETVVQLLRQAKAGGRRVRAFGEMVAILWAQGYKGAAIQLEQLWSRLCLKENLCLFCSYPKSGFEESIDTAIGHVCSVHSKVVTQAGIVPSRHYISA